MDYFNETGTEAIEKCYQYFLKNSQGATVYIPDDFSPFYEKFVFVLTSIEAYFHSQSKSKGNAGVCQKVDDESLDELEIARKAPSVPTFILLGE